MAQPTVTTIQDRDHLINTIMASHTGKGRGKAPRIVTASDGEQPYTYLVAVTASNHGVFLVCDSPSYLTEEVYEAIAEEAKEAGLADDFFHVHSKLNLIMTDDVAWYQLAG